MKESAQQYLIVCKCVTKATGLLRLACEQNDTLNRDIKLFCDAAAKFWSKSTLEDVTELEEWNEVDAYDSADKILEAFSIFVRDTHEGDNAPEFTETLMQNQDALREWLLASQYGKKWVPELDELEHAICEVLTGMFIVPEIVVRLELTEFGRKYITDHGNLPHRTTVLARLQRLERLGIVDRPNGTNSGWRLAKII